MKGSRPLTKEEIKKIKSLFSGCMHKRNLSLFLLGANTGFRISELLSLRLDDVLEEDGRIKSRLTVTRKNMKGNKSGRTVLLNNAGKKGIAPWLIELKRMDVIHKDDFVFRSKNGPNRAISRVQVWKILNTVYRSAGLTGKLGTQEGKSPLI